MLVDIIMPVHSGVNHLFFESAIKAIETQTYRNWNLYLGLDGDIGDKNYNVINAHKANNQIKVHQIKTTRKPGYIRDYLIKQGKGDFVFIADSDDISLSNRIDRSIYYINKFNADVFWTTMNIINNNNIIYKSRSFLPNLKTLKTLSLIRCPINNASVCFSRKLYETTGYNLSLRVSEDYYLWVSMIAKGVNFYCAEENLVNYRQDDSDYLKRRGITYFKADMKVKIYALKLYGINTRNIYFFLIGSIFCTLKILPISIFKFIYKRARL